MKINIDYEEINQEKEKGETRFKPYNVSLCLNFLKSECKLSIVALHILGKVL